VTNADKISAGKSGGKTPLRRSECRCNFKIKIGRRETWLEGVEWVHLIQDRTSGGLCEHGNELRVSIKSGDCND
jgi:hypothetical protein